MVKNLSNPLNARKVASILADDANTEGFAVDERDISVYLSDHRISDLETALKQLKQEGIIPDEYYVSNAGHTMLLDENFIDESHRVTKSEETTTEQGLDLLGDINTESIEFKTQLDSLKNKLIKAWSGGISIDGHELDNFERKFSRPMKYFKDLLSEKGDEISDMQAFAVVYATDHLSLGDNSKEDVYYLMFGRYDQIKDELADRFGFSYKWPDISGTSFIQMGKKYCVGPELAEFAKRFRGISGLDTYPDEVIQVFFFHLITGSLIEEMVRKQILYRWADDSTIITDPLQWLIPPPDFNMDRNLRELLNQAVITHTLLIKIESDNPSLLEILDEIDELDPGTRSAYLAKKVEAALTRKSVALQFGTTLANFFENFKTNPAQVTPFLDTTIKYFSKTENIKTVVGTIQHSIRTGLKNSTGIIRQYLKDIGDEELISTIRRNLELSIRYAVEHALTEYKSEIITDTTINYEKLDTILRSFNEGALKTLFIMIFEQIFQHTQQFAKDLEPERQEPVSKEGGLTELTQDFISTAKYHGSKNWTTKTMINNMVENGLTADVAEMICYISSYITYQVASMEGDDGETMLMSLIKNYEQKAHKLASILLTDGTMLGAHDELVEFITNDLRQAHVLVALASKLKSDVYNAWTPIKGGKPKHVRFYNELILPNLLYWQRQPREFIMPLVKVGLLDKSEIKSTVAKTKRLSMIEAYCLLVMGTSPEINNFYQAEQYLVDLFNTEGDITESFVLNAKSGEAEIAMESILLWSDLQEVA